MKGTDMDKAHGQGAWRTDEELGGRTKSIDDGQRRKMRMHPCTSSGRPLASLIVDRRCHCHRVTKQMTSVVLADGGQCTGIGRAISIIIDGWMIYYSSVELKRQEESSSIECMEEFSIYKWSPSGVCSLINRGPHAQATQSIRCSTSRICI